MEIFKKYPYRAVIIEKRGDAHRWDFDVARRIKTKQGFETFYLKKNQVIIPPADYINIGIDRKGRNILPLYSPQYGQYGPMNIINPPNLTVEDKEMSNWAVLMHKETAEKYRNKQSFLEKYASYIMLATVVGLVAFMVIYITQSMQTIASTAASAAGELARRASTTPIQNPPLT